MAVSEDVGQDVLEREVRVEFRPSRAPGFAAIVELCGEHDIASSEEINAVLAGIRGDILLDLSACAFLDSSVIQALIVTSADLERDGYSLEILAPASNVTVSRTLDVIGLRALIAVHAEPPSADARGC